MESKNEIKVEHILEGKLTKKLRQNPYIVSTIVLGVACLILLILALSSGSTVNGNDAGEKIVDFFNAKGAGLEYVSYEDIGNLYEITVKYQGQNVPIYTTKDGQYYTLSIVPITEVNETETPNDIPKSDKPKVELFIMTHCPGGTQAEKGFIPAIKALGSKVDANIRFVHYFMHGDKEEAETYTQVCIREEQSSKYLTYLECFLEDGNSDRCLTKTGIDKTKLNTCLSTNKSKEYYAADSALSNQYGVQGSPTLIINGVEASSARNPQALLTAICSAFNTSPGECSQQLSTANPSAGFGVATSGTTGDAAAAASCS